MPLVAVLGLVLGLIAIIDLLVEEKDHKQEQMLQMNHQDKRKNSKMAAGDHRMHAGDQQQQQQLLSNLLPKALQQ